MTARPPAINPAIEPVVHESTPGIIAARIREAIGNGTLAPGSQVGEAEYARILGVSRGPLREGMQRLVQEGLLTARPHRGHFVIDTTPENVRDIYLARTAIERAAAAEAHRLDAQTTADALLAVVADMERAEKKRDEYAVSSADITFHRVLVECAQSPRLTRTHETLITETRMCIHALEPTYTGAGIRAKEHRRLADSFAAGDPQLTDRLLVDHMRDAVKRLQTREVSGD